MRSFFGGPDPHKGVTTASLHFEGEPHYKKLGCYFFGYIGIIAFIFYDNINAGIVKTHNLFVLVLHPLR